MEYIAQRKNVSPRTRCAKMMKHPISDTRKRHQTKGCHHQK